MSYDLYLEKKYGQFLINFDTQRLDCIEKSHSLHFCSKKLTLSISHIDSMPSTKGSPLQVRTTGALIQLHKKSEVAFFSFSLFRLFQQLGQ